MPSLRVMFLNLTTPALPRVQKPTVRNSLVARGNVNGGGFHEAHERFIGRGDPRRLGVTVRTGQLTNHLRQRFHEHLGPTDGTRGYAMVQP